MGRKTISGWDKEKQALLEEIVKETGDNQSETIRKALAVYQLLLGFEEKYDELIRVKKVGRPKELPAKNKTK